MKLPQWKTTGQIEARKQTAQLQTFIPQHSAPQQRFIPEVTSSQIANTESSKIRAVVVGGHAINAAYQRVKDAREAAELRMAEADWVNATSAVESGMVTQPHEVEVRDENGQVVMNPTTGLPEVRRPWETAKDEFSKYSIKLEEELSERHLSSKKNKAAFAQYAAKQRAMASGRIEKWAMGHEAERANAGFTRAIDEAKSHERVVALRQEALTKHADPTTIEKASQKAHQRITFTAINDHLASVALNLNNGSMSEESLSTHLQDAYGIWEEVKHRLSSEQNKAILNNIVRMDKEFYTTIQPRLQAETMVNDIVRFRLGNAQDRQEITTQLLNTDLYERYGSHGDKIANLLLDFTEEGTDTRDGRMAAEQLLTDAKYNDQLDQRSAIGNVITLIDTRQLKVDTGLQYIGEITSAGVNGNKREDQLSNQIFEAATTAVQETLPAAFASLTPKEQQRMAADAKSDLAILRVKYERAVEKNPHADRLMLAKDIMLDVRVPPWVIGQDGKPAMSIVDADWESTKYAQSQAQADKKVPSRDIMLWEEKIRQTQRLLQGIEEVK